MTTLPNMVADGWIERSSRSSAARGRGRGDFLYLPSRLTLAWIVQGHLRPYVVSRLSLRACLAFGAWLSNARA